MVFNNCIIKSRKRQTGPYVKALSQCAENSRVCIYDAYLLSFGAIVQYK